MSRPPGRTTCAAWCSSRRCAAASAAKSASVLRHLTSGSRRIIPSPEHGASTRTASNPARNGSGSSAFARRTRIDRAPDAATVRASNSTRRPRRSVATTSPSSPIAAAIAVVLPPGDAQASRIRSPGRAAANSATSWEASSWTKNDPFPARPVSSGLPSRTISASSANRPGSTRTPSSARLRTTASRVVRRRLIRSVSGAAALLKPSHASVASNP